MGITNLQAGLEHEIACHRGELAELETQIDQAKRLIEDLPNMISRAAELREVIDAAAKVLKFRKPEWDSESIRPKRRTALNNPIPFGNISQTMLAILRERQGKPIRTRDIGREILRAHGIEDFDRRLLDRVTNSVGASLRDYKERGVVESVGKHINEWVVIQ